MTLLILKAPRVFHVAKLPVMVYTIKQKLIFSFPRVLITKYHKLGGFEQRKFYGLTILEDKTPQSVSRTVFLLKDLGKNLFHAFFSASGCWLAILGFLGLYNSTRLLTRCILPLCSHGSLLIRTPVVLD